MNDKYVPALGFGALTRLYDPAIRLFMPETRFKNRLMEQAKIDKGQKILDIGCGTATLTILIKKSYPDAEVTGLDGDPGILEIARSKVSSSGLIISLDKGMSFDMPYEEGSFDRVFSSLMFHHLTRQDKIQTLKEVFRVLRPGGELHLADFGKPHNFMMYLISLVTRLGEETGDNIKGMLPNMFQNAGFVDIGETARYASILGTISIYRAVKPE